MKQKFTQLVFLAMLFFCAFQTAFGQSSDEPQTLLPNQTIEREMTGAQTHRYKFDLKANEFFQVRVEQKGLDVMLKLLDESGKTVAEMDSPNGKEGFETLSFVAEKDATFVLETISPNEKAEKGTYIITRAASRTATAQDKRRVEVEKSFVEGIKSRDTEGQAEIGIAKLEEALKGWQELQDSHLAELTAKNLTELKENKYYATFLKFFRDLQKASDVLDEGSNLAFRSKADSILAREKLNEALSLFHKVIVSVNDKTFVDKIYQSSEKSPQSLHWLRSLQYYAKGGETSCLERIAQTYYNLSEWEDYINFKKLALAGYQEILTKKEWETVIDPKILPNMQILEIQKLKEVGESLADYLGKNDEGFVYLNQALERSRVRHKETQNSQFRLLEAQILTASAFIYGRQSKTTSESIEFFTKALKIYRTLPNRKQNEAEMLSMIALRYMTNLQYLEARKNFEDALQIFKDTDYKFGQTSILQTLAVMFSALNNKTETAKYANQNLLILQSPDYTENYLKNFEKNTASLKDFEVFRENQTFFIEYTRLGAIGLSYRLMENYPKSIEFYKKTLDAARVTKDLTKIKGSLFDVGFVLGKLQKWEESVAYYLEQLEVSRQLGNREDIANSLHDVGGALFEAGKPQEALKYQNEALLFFQSVEVNENKQFSLTYSSFLNQISLTHYALGNRRLAILYGKRAVNAMQGERQRLQNLDLLSQKGFLERKEKHYRRLAEWLIESGRLVEAEQVLAMLKEEEVADYLRRDRSFAEKLSLRIEFTPREKEALAGYQKNAETLSAIGGEFSKLEDLKRKGVKFTEEQEKRFEELKLKQTEANIAFQNFLNRLGEDFKNNKNPEQDLRENFNLQSDLKSFGEGVVFVYTLVGEDKFSSILVTPDAEVSHQESKKAADLNAKIFAFRNAVKNPNIDPRPLGKELYDILIKPFEKDLDAAKARTILWHLDGNLRLLPLAALWDGKQYFGQKYQNVVITGKSLTRIGKEVSTNLNVLGLGVSDAKTVAETLTERRFDFSALPSVPFELDSIVQTAKSRKGVLPGASFLNQGFTRKSFAEQLLKGYKIIHIASHFSINSGDASRSFLLLGDGSVLTVSELNIDPLFKNKFQNVELLVLSACDTAVGETDSNGKEVEGFAYVAQQNGARAILATLWSVADESTALLMSEFYRIRKANPNLTKAEALQMAQKLMIEGKLKPSGTNSGCRSNVVKLDGTTETPYKCDANMPFAHPFYWSPFVLIGNWK